MTTRHLAVALIASLVVGGCSSDEGSDGEGSGAEACAPRVHGTEAGQKTPHPEKPTSCLGVVLFCNFCEYADDGSLKGSGSEPCGICFGADF